MEQKNGKTMSIVALICGIIGVSSLFVANIVYCIIALVLAILGIIFGAIGMKQSKAANGKSSGMAVAGLVCGIVGTVFGVIGLACVACATCALAAIAEDPDAIASAITEATASIS